ncbi:MAG TPA: hypothetical protein PKN87_09570 [Syntrophomonadaceae bacterium]|nr:hypothetical protein [Syntrophomonadaceae bacterium]HPR94366.1 hypothetical protein [Syntrophomonadaceae bacterium]
MGKLNRKWCVLAAVPLLVMLLSPAVLAVEIKSGSMVDVSGDPVKGPLFISGENLTVNADVDGDVFAAGQSITINGQVNGDVIAAGNSVRVNGKIIGDVRAVANTVDINGLVYRNITGAASSITIGTDADINGDVLLMAKGFTIAGNVDGQVLGSAEQVQLNGIIDDNVRLWDVNHLTIGPPAVINGSITYNSDNQAQVSSAAKIGSITKLTPTAQADQTAQNTGWGGFSWWGLLWSLAAGLIIWGAAQWLLPQLFPRLSKTAEESTGASLGWGFIALLVAPLAFILLSLTVIGIPLVIILLFSLIIIFILSEVIVSDTLGRIIARSFNWEGRVPLIVPFLMSLLLIDLLSRIPVGGFFVKLIAACFALGMVILTIYRYRVDDSPAQLPPSDI